MGYPRSSLHRRCLVNLSRPRLFNRIKERHPMTNEQILTKAVEKALEGPWDGNEFCGYAPNPHKRSASEVIAEIRTYNPQTEEYGGIDKFKVRNLLFYHDFARALWKDAKIPDPVDDEAGVPVLSLYEGGGYEGYGDYVNFLGEPWQFHLQQMVLDPDPIKYLGEHL